MKKTSLRTRAALGFSDFQVAGEEDDEAEEDLQVFFCSLLFCFLSSLSSPLRELSSLPLDNSSLRIKGEGGLSCFSFLLI